MQTIPEQWCVVPEKNGIPVIKWTPYMTEKPSAGLLADWMREYWQDGADYGLVCGAVSGVVGLDIDSDAEEPAILALIPYAEDMLAKKGSKGRTIIFNYNASLVNRSWKKNGKVICELLSDKRKCTIPPSLHRVTSEPYIWLEGAKIVDDLPEGFIAAMDAMYPEPKRVERTTWVEEGAFDKVDLSEVSDMLGYISADGARDEWLAVGMALRSEFGDAAYSLWDQWSSGSSKYKPREIPCVWRSFNGSGVSIASLVYYAQQGGYIKKRVAVERVAAAAAAVPAPAPVLTAHGLVGEIAAWITATAYRPQPQLALGAALTFVGMLKGHKYCTVTGLRSNFLAMNIAPTGGGKEHPLDCIEILAAQAGLGQHLMSEPTAGTSLLKGILDADRVGLWAIDELGRYLGHIANKNAGGYQREIIDYVIKSFSKANSVLRGKKFANEKINPQINIVNPHLCVVGASVKEKILENCASTDAIDGFLNRWILFESVERPRRRKEAVSKTAVPQSILDAVQAVLDDDPNRGLLLTAEELPTVRTIRYTPEAYALFDEYTENVEDLIDKSESLLQSLYIRSCEHVAKLSLILCDNEFIRCEDVELAIKIVSESNTLIVNFTNMIADNETEADYIKVREIIYKAGEIKKAELTRRTQFIAGGARRRNEILRDLVESGEVEHKEDGKLQTFSREFKG